jgi:hypothetical protein
MCRRRLRRQGERRLGASTRKAEPILRSPPCFDSQTDSQQLNPTERERERERERESGRRLEMKSRETWMSRLWDFKWRIRDSGDSV